MTQISEDYVTSWAIRRRVNPAAVLGTSQDGAPSLTNNYLFIVTEQNNGNSVQHNSRYLINILNLKNFFKFLFLTFGCFLFLQLRTRKKRHRRKGIGFLLRAIIVFDVV